MESPLDALHGDTVVSEITIKMRRNGVMSVEGCITHEAYAKHLLDTARTVLKNFHKAQRAGNRNPIVVPAHDTSLVGSPEEKMLLGARHELSNAMARR